MILLLFTGVKTLIYTTVIREISITLSLALEILLTIQNISHIANKTTKYLEGVTPYWEILFDIETIESTSSGSEAKGKYFLNTLATESFFAIGVTIIIMNRLKIVYHRIRWDTSPCGQLLVISILPKYTYRIPVYVVINGITIKYIRNLKIL